MDEICYELEESHSGNMNTRKNLDGTVAPVAVMKQPADGKQTSWKKSVDWDSVDGRCVTAIVPRNLNDAAPTVTNKSLRAKKKKASTAIARTCSVCKEDKGRADFASHRWYHGDRRRKCTICVEAEQQKIAQMRRRALGVEK